MKPTSSTVTVMEPTAWQQRRREWFCVTLSCRAHGVVDHCTAYIHAVCDYSPRCISAFHWLGK